MGEIVVGVDGSAGGASALRWAVDESRLLALPVTAVSVRCPPRRSGLLARPDGLDERGAASALEQHVRDALGSPGEIERRTAFGDPGAVLACESRHASLLVLGAQGHGPLRRLLIGSVGRHCLQHGACPVVIVRGLADARIDDAPVVVGVNATDPSIAALNWAAAEASRRSAPLEIVHAWRYPIIGQDVAASVDPARLERLASAELDTIIRHAGPLDRGGTIIRTVVCDSAGHALMRASKGAGLLVVGLRGSAPAGRLLGSTASELAHGAACPVVVVPTGVDDRSPHGHLRRPARHPRPSTPAA